MVALLKAMARKGIIFALNMAKKIGNFIFALCAFVLFGAMAIAGFAVVCVGLGIAVASPLFIIH